MSGGLLAVGDSIVNGHANSMARVPSLSWAQWVADAMGLSYMRFARGGATSDDIVRELLPRVSGKYEVGAFNMGTNDAYLGLDLSKLKRNLDFAAARFVDCCDRVLVLTVPYSEAATAEVREVAERHGLLVVDAELHGARLMQPDGIHPTALGHLKLADRAAALLSSPRPSELAIKQGRGRLPLTYWPAWGLGWGKAQAKERIKRTVRR